MTFEAVSDCKIDFDIENVRAECAMRWWYINVRGEFFVIIAMYTEFYERQRR